MTTIPVRPQRSVSQRRPALSRSLESLFTLLILLTPLDQQAAAQSPADEKRSFDIPAQSLESALIEWSRQSDIQVMVAGDVLRGHKTQALKGTLSTRVALATLLESTGLDAEYRISDNTVTVKPSGSAAQETAGSKDRPSQQPAPQSGEKSTTAQPASSQAGDRSNEGRGESGARPLEEVVVTGTLIRGQAPVGAQLLTMGRAEIEATGLTTVQDVIRTLPQNFTGGVSEDTASSAFGREAGTNSSRASAINLRGVGAGATLLLVNGRRLAPGGTRGAFTDVSGIPLAAVERVEVIPDGASALYGSDAIGGVVNIILRSGYKGADSAVQYGSVTDGDTYEGVVSQVLGATWEAGHGLIAAEYRQRDALPNAERRQSATSDLRALGGSDFRTLFGNPGTIQIGTQTWAIPPGQNGSNLSPDALVAGTRNLHNQNEDRDLVAEQERWGIVGTLEHTLNGRTKVFADVVYSERDVQAETGGNLALLTVPSTNPYYVNPTGGTGPIRVSYSFLRDLGPIESEVDVENAHATLGAAVDLWADWQMTTALSYGREEEAQVQAPFINSTAQATALADPNPDTALNPFGDGSFTNPATLASIRGQSEFGKTTQLREASATTDGGLLQLSGGSAKLAFGIAYRRESLDSTQRISGTPQAVSAYDRNVRAAFGELAIPFVGPANRRAALEALELSLAARYERYSDFGDTTVPKVGLTWSPLRALSLRSTWSKSFKAPNVADLDETIGTTSMLQTNVPDSTSPTGRSTVLNRFGNNADLKSETATIWTAGVKFDPAAIPGFSLQLTYYDIEFEDRIDRLFTPLTVLEDPQYAALVTRNPTPEQREEACSRGRFAGIPADCRNVPIAAIVDQRFNNIALLRTSGFDLLSSYTVATAAGDFTVGINGNYVRDFSQARATSQPFQQLVDTQTNPLRLRLRGSVAWERGDLSAHMFVNHAGSYTDSVSVPNRSVDSWTTVDGQIRYSAADRWPGLFSGLSLSLNVQNLFDEAPPFLNNSFGLGYDQANADLLGRFISLQARKSW